MLAKSVAALAALSFVAGVTAEPLPYRPNVMKTSARSLFGILRRDDTPGYQPGTEVCGQGATCAAACGAGYETCTSTDSQIHCFNPTVGDTCCPNGSGNSCETGYYCTSDAKHETWCCPNGMGLDECAKAYGVDGTLVSQTSTPTTPTPAATPSPNNNSNTSTTTTSSPATTTLTAGDEDDEESDDEEEGAKTNPSFLPSSIVNPPSATANTSPTRTPPVQGAGSGLVAPASALVLLAAGVAALF